VKADSRILTASGGHGAPHFFYEGNMTHTADRRFKRISGVLCGVVTAS
jgi:hypothetical protein